jgi:hypothetical protein
MSTLAQYCRYYRQAKWWLPCRQGNQSSNDPTFGTPAVPFRAAGTKDAVPNRVSYLDIQFRHFCQKDFAKRIVNVRVTRLSQGAAFGHRPPASMGRAGVEYVTCISLESRLCPAFVRERKAEHIVKSRQTCVAECQLPRPISITSSIIDRSRPISYCGDRART